MRKVLCVLLALIMLTLPITASAATARSASIRLSLSYSGTTATCAVVTVSDYTTDEITCVLKLWRGSTCIATWEGEGSGYLHMSETKTITSGVEYTLTADVVINGVAQPRASMTK